VALAAAGLWFLSRPTAGGFNRGDVLTALCAACFAVEVVLVQKYTQRHGPMAMIMVQIIATIGLSALLVAFFETPRLVWSNTLILDIFVTSVLATAGSLVIQFYYQRRTTPARAAIIYTMEPVFAAGFAYLILDERMPRLAWLGAALILVGMVVAETGKLANLRPLGVPHLSEKID
jgi:drug/metabolite transporter (DMT)-like permease